MVYPGAILRFVATPYGAWRSTIGTDALLAGELRYGAPAFDGEVVIWPERRPTEGGRTVLVRGERGCGRM